MTPVDAALFSRAAAGDRDAFWGLMLPFRGLIYSVALGILHDHERAEDQLHDVLLHAYQTLHTLRRPEKLASWLYTMTRHRVLDSLRRDGRRRGALAELTRDGEGFSLPAAFGADSEDAQALDSALSRLPEPFRVILALKYVNDYAYQEIAAILELPLSTVKSRLFEARKLLRTLMEGDAASGENEGTKGGGERGAR